MRGLARATQAMSSSVSKSFSTNANSITLDLGDVFSTHCESGLFPNLHLIGRTNDDNSNVCL